MKRIFLAGFIWLIALGPGAQSLLPQTTAGWRPIGPPGAEVLSAAISPDDPDHCFIIAADPLRDSSLYETKDGGETWHFVDAGTRPCFRVAWNEDAAQSIFVIQDSGLLRSRDGGASWQFLPIGFPGWELSSASRIAFAPPPRSETLWITGAGRRFNTTPTILESISGGETWTLRVLPGTGGAEAAAFCPKNPDLVYVSAGEKLLRSRNGGDAWEVVAPLRASQILIDATDEDTLYVSADGIQRSCDAGRTWTVLTDRAFVLADRPGPGGLLFAGGYGRILRSADGGRTWSETAKPEFGTATEIAVSSRRVLFATDVGIHASDDGGMSWREMRTGLSGHFISDLVVAPSSPRVIYAATENSGLFRTDDGGAVWRRLAGFSCDTPILKILVEPSDPDCVYALFFKNPDIRLAVSENGGLAWTLRPIKGLADIFLSPHRRGVIFATSETADGARFHRSFDGGATWTSVALSSGSFAWAKGIAQDFVDPAVLYAIVLGSDGAELDLMKSEDTGSTWTRIRADPNRIVHLLALDPASRTADQRRNSRIYIAGEGGLFRSDDEGRSMARLFDAEVKSLVVNPSRSEHVFVSADGQTQWVSASYDRGASWTRREPASGDLRLVTSLVLDPVGRILYAGTRGGGVYAHDGLADPLFPPPDFRAAVNLNRSLALREYVHVLTWADDSRNPLLAAYQVMVWEYDPEHPEAGENYVLAAEVPASSKELVRRAMNPKHRYSYRLRGVDLAGRTTPWASAEIAPVD